MCRRQCLLWVPCRHMPLPAHRVAGRMEKVVIIVVIITTLVMEGIVAGAGGSTVYCIRLAFKN